MKSLFILLFPLFVFAQNQDYQESKKGEENQNEIQSEKQLSIDQQKNNQNKPRWSFGVIYIPYYSNKIYKYFRNPYYSNQFYITSDSENIIMMEGQFSYLFYPGLRLTLDIGYLSTYSRNKSEEHVRYDDPNYIDYDNGTIETDDLKIFSFNFGIKYYLVKLKSQRVSPYVLAGIGKKFAFVNNKSEILYQDGIPDITFDDNRNEFLEDLNSPFQINLGFGAEYMLNNFISLFSNIKFYYSKRNAEYDYREIWNYSQRKETGKTEYKNSEIATHIGLGINYYF